MSKSSWMIISVLLFVAVLGCQISAVGSDVLSPFWKTKSPMCYKRSNRIDDPAGYQLALQKYRDSFTRASYKMIRHHPYLLDQKVPWEEPLEWVTVKQPGWEGDECTLLFRADNMYLVGFANKKGTWFTFKGSHHLIPGSIPLDIETDYKGLVDGWNKLGTVPLGGDSHGLAVRNFSSFDEKTSNMQHARLSAAQVIVMFPEALRFFPIRNKIIAGWETGVSLDEEEERELLVSWKDICLSLRDWDRYNIWDGSRIRTSVATKYNINSGGDALKVVDVIFGPRNDGLAH